MVDYSKSIKDSNLDKIYINGVEFKGIARDSALGWEDFVWAEDPTRSNAFAFENMDDIDVGLVARCEVNFKYFNINDFIKFREAIKQRYFQVKFFNVDTCQWMQREMYCSKSERKKLHYFNPRLLGVLDFSVQLVATNRDVMNRGPVTISYNSNGGSGSISSEQIVWAEQYTTNDGSNFSKPGQSLSSWNTKPDGSGWTYLPTQSFTAFKDLTLYAIWG